MKRQAPAPLPAPTPLLQRTQQLRTLWASLPACVSAFAPQRPATS